MPNRLARGFQSGFVALVLASGALLLFFLHYDYQRTIREGEVRLSHVADLFNEHFLGSLELATLRAEAMTERLAGFNLYRVPALEAEHGEGLRRFVEDVDQIAAMVVLDREGAVRWASIEGVLGLYLNDRDYFQGTLEGGGNGYVVGAPLDSPITGMRVTPIAWPIRADDGTVLGVMASSLEASYFRALLEETRFDPEMTLDIRAEDGAAAFISEASGSSDETRLIQVSEPIPGTGLKTVLALPRPVVIRSFVLRAIGFTVVFALLSSLALYAALIAHRRMLALRGAASRRPSARRGRPSAPPSSFRRSSRMSTTASSCSTRSANSVPRTAARRNSSASTAPAPRSSGSGPARRWSSTSWSTAPRSSLSPMPAAMPK